MTLIITLDDETEQALERNAQRLGITVSDYVRRMAERAVKPRKQPSDSKKTKTGAEVLAESRKKRRVILDTDILIELLREHDQPEAWLSGLYALPSISGTAALEALFGARDLSEQRKVDVYLQRFRILWPSEPDAQTTRCLARYHLSDGIELNDVMTTTVALRHKLTLVTFNTKHFRAIPGLTAVEPYVR